MKAWQLNQEKKTKNRMTNKIADIIIPHHDRHDHLKNCLDSIPKGMFNIIIVSGGSFAENCNKGARLAETDNLIFVNDDTIPGHKALVALANANEDFVGVTEFIPATAKHYYGIGFRDDNGRISGFKATDMYDMVFPCGYLFKVKRNMWENLGGFDEDFINGGEDGDFGFRALEAGYSIGWIDIPVTHYHSQSEGRLKYSRENQNLLDKKWSEEKKKELVRLKDKTVKRLDILLATNHLDRLGGSETWTLAMHKELSKNHNVEVFTLKDGDLIETVQPKAEYDLIIINHNTCLDKLRDIKGFKIFTSHGVFPEIEQPKDGADAYVAISPEVSGNLAVKGYDNTIIYNGIDCERFSPKKVINDKPKSVLSMCQGEEATKMIKQACDELGLKFEAIERDKLDVENYINRADIVVSLGRGAYEAMACGRAVFIFDNRSYVIDSPFGDGLVTEHNWIELMSNNFSGRSRKIFYTVEDIKNNFLAYTKEMGQINRNLALNNFNIKNQAQKYLDIYEKKQISKNN